MCGPLKTALDPAAAILPEQVTNPASMVLGKKASELVDPVDAYARRTNTPGPAKAPYGSSLAIPGGQQQPPADLSIPMGN